MTADTTDIRPVLEAERERLRRRLQAIDVLLESDGAMPLADMPVPTAPAPSAPARRGAGVSPAKLKAVHKYLESKGEVRQVEITNDLEENSGSVSLALRALEAQGVAQDTGKVVNKSKVWRFTGEPERSTVLEPGVGVRQGRKRSS